LTFCFTLIGFSFSLQGSSNNYESNQQRSGGWRTNSSMSDRDPNSRRPQAKRDRKMSFNEITCYQLLLFSISFLKSILTI